ncbi:MAG: ABC transporter ATP-binding protein [Pseudomonadota bacterium]
MNSQPLNRNFVLQLSGLEKTFQQGGRALTVFKDLQLHISSGEIVGLVGQSGSGKSTLLHIAGLLDKPSKGHVFINNEETKKLGDRKRTMLRRNSIGFIYQFHHLLPEFSAVENVAMPLIVAGVNRKKAKHEAAGMLGELGLGDRLTHRPTQLSGGEQQRVAIARALINEPALLLADEPTGNLDPDTSAEVFELLMYQVKERGIGALVATHNHALAQSMSRAVELKAGQIVSF